MQIVFQENNLSMSSVDRAFCLGSIALDRFDNVNVNQDIA